MKTTQFSKNPRSIKEYWKIIYTDLSVNIANIFYKGRGKTIRNFAIGLPRSGTHSIVSILERNSSALHEPLVGKTVTFILRYKYGKISRKQLIKHILYREKHLKAEFEAAHYLHHISDVLRDLYPSSKFVLTVREPLSWLESEIGKNMRTYSKGHYSDTILRKFRYGEYKHSFSEHEKQIEGIYPIQSYLAYWKDHLQQVLQSIPEDRLLVIPTKDISNSIMSLSNFLNVAIEKDNVNSHSDQLNRETLNLNSIADVELYIIPLIETDLLDFIITHFPFLLADMQYINKL